VLVNNAGINVFSPAELLAEEKARQIMEVNFWGPVRLALGALRVFRDVNPRVGDGKGRRGGMILQVSSIGGRIAVPAHAAYHASKFALEGWSEGLSREVDPGWGVRLCILEPGGVRTEFLGKSREGVEGWMGQQEEGGDGDGDGEERRLKEVYRDCGPVKAMMEGLMSEGLEGGMADPGDVVKTVVGVLEKEDGRLPLRLLLGKDAVAAVGQLEGQRRDEFEAWKGAGESVGVDGAEVPLGK
jgi:NAD(P)-dependent dehydrogenase (short-subunit alcohol dehydrogenase family)